MLDEAHLSRPFEKLLGSIEQFNKTCGTGVSPMEPLRVIRMSATSGDNGSDRFKLEESDLNDKVIEERFTANKSLTVQTTADVIDSIANAAGELVSDKPGSRIVIFVKSPKDVDAVRKVLIKKDKTRENKIAMLTGTMRGLERDELVDTEKPLGEKDHERRAMQRFLNPENDSSQGECFLISTSAGEVGFDLNADHLVGDEAPLDSWIQRLGRVNRRGHGDATVMLIKSKEPADKTDFDKACLATSDLLTAGMNVSPKALTTFKKNLTPEQIEKASSPKPTTVELTDILLDAWSMTSITEPMPGRPEVGPWLRGIADELPQTTIAWRAELDEPGFADLELDDIKEWFDTHRILTHETLSVPTSVAAKWLTDRWDNLDDRQKAEVGDRSIVIDRSGLKRVTVKEVIDQLNRKNADSIRFADLILPASFGGIERGEGLLDSAAPKQPEDANNADEQTRQSNAKARLAAPDVADLAEGLRRQREIITKTEDGEPEHRIIGGGTSPCNPAHFRIELASDDDRTVRLVSHIPKREKPEYGSKKQTLQQHVGEVRKAVDDILSRLSLSENFTLAAQLAADWHDHGKNRERWQRLVGGEVTPSGQDWLDATLGKSGGEMKHDSRGYRHEFGSLSEFTDAFNAGKLLDNTGKPICRDVFDLAIHLIAVHHGRGRPHFPKGGFDPDCESRSDEIHTESIRRFARLQKKYGWWHLAWLENLLRCADALASADNDAEDDPADATGEKGGTP